MPSAGTYDRVLERKGDFQSETALPGTLLEELVGGVYPEKVKLLGHRTGELHLALASRSDDPAFAPEPFNAMAQRLRLPKHAHIPAPRVYVVGEEIVGCPCEIPK